MTGTRGHHTVGVHAVAPPHRSLVPLERDVHTGRPVDLDRSDKHRHDDAGRTDPPRPHQRPRWLRPRAVTAVGAGVAVAAIITTVFLVTSPGEPSAGGDPPSSSSLTTPTTSPSPSPSLSASTLPRSTAGSTLSATGPTTPVGPTTRLSVAAGALTSSRLVTSASPAPTIDAGAIAYYAATATYTRFVRPKGAQDGHPTVGDVENYQYPCDKGACTFYIGPPGSTFAAGAPSFTGRYAPVSPDTGPIPCDVVFTWDFVRQADGSYTGTIDFQPKQIEADFPGGHCTSFAATQQVVLVPIAR
jgi:hypothetical protein